MIIVNKDEFNREYQEIFADFENIQKLIKDQSIISFFVSTKYVEIVLLNLKIELQIFKKLLEDDGSNRKILTECQNNAMLYRDELMNMISIAQNAKGMVLKTSATRIKKYLSKSLGG
ncbi:MAG: hypothetical protein FWG80_04775 [Alphaproteobacteria bacterium]|nr:hypothetical protein [Alphaproteobacteria bacterium]